MNKAVTFVLLSSVLSLSPVSFANASSSNIAEGKPATASSSEGTNYLPDQAVDGSQRTRWASDRTEENWLAIDLQGRYDIGSISLHWEAAYAEDYEIQVSEDGYNWVTAKQVNGGHGGVEEKTINETASHIRINTLRRGTSWGVSLWEVEVLGSPAGMEARDELVSAGKPVRASSVSEQHLVPENVVDGSDQTRWSSEYVDNAWVEVDLQGQYHISDVELRWEDAHSQEYEIKTSYDGESWQTIHQVTDGEGGNERLSVAGHGRYVRVESSVRGTRWGISLWELEVFGSPAEMDRGDLVSEGRPVAASSVSESNLVPENVVDGSDETRWSSEYVDNAWIMVDLEGEHQISEVQLRWEVAHSQDYEIQTSYDGENWRTIHRVTDSQGGRETLTVSGHGRYVRVEGLSRATEWGHSLWQLEVYGKPVPVELVSEGRPVQASSVSEPDLTPENAVDGNRQTRWSSEYEDNAWLMLDLESNHSITEVQLSWEAAHALAYEIQTSYDGENWNTIYTESEGRGGDETIQVTGHGRYLRFEGLSRATRWGHSLWELEIYGFEAATGSNEDSSSAEVMTLEWTASTLRENGDYLSPGEIDGYEIRYRRAGESEHQSQLIRNGSTTSFAFDWLAGDYEFTIAVYDTNGLYSRFVPLTPIEQR